MSYYFLEFMVGNHCTYILFRFYVVWWWTIRNQINESCELISEVEFKTSTRLSSSTRSRLDQDRFTIHAILSDIYQILHLAFKNIILITIEGSILVCCILYAVLTVYTSVHSELQKRTVFDPLKSAKESIQGIFLWIRMWCSRQYLS